MAGPVVSNGLQRVGGAIPSSLQRVGGVVDTGTYQYVGGQTGPITGSPATATTLTGPTSGNVGVLSSQFTVGVNGAISGTVIITPSDSSGGGTFSPTTVTLSPSSATGTFQYTPGSSGTKSISTSNNASLTNPTPISFVVASSGAATALTLSGPSTSTVGTPSSNFTVGANGTISGTVVVTPSAGGGGGTFSPTTVSLTSGSPTATFTYTAASAGSKSIAITNNGSLGNPSPVALTASSGSTAVVLDQLANMTNTSGTYTATSGTASYSDTFGSRTTQLLAVGATGGLAGTITPAGGAVGIGLDGDATNTTFTAWDVLMTSSFSGGWAVFEGGVNTFTSTSGILNSGQVMTVRRNSGGFIEFLVDGTVGFTTGAAYPGVKYAHATLNGGTTPSLSNLVAV